jgi:membrane-bound lytic murein transglycosylase MltF
VAVLEDLAGQEVFVRQSSSYWEHLELLNERFRREGRPAITLRVAPENLEDKDFLEMVNAGLVSLIVVDDYSARLWANAFPQLVLHPEIVVSTGSQFAWMIRPGSPRLQAAIRGFAKVHRQGTACGNMIVKKYALNPKLVTNATSAREMKKFQTKVGLFRRYSEMYDMDYLLMMAQAYQESRLDQRARSEDGAVGVMQIIPATGEEMKVGDVTKLGPNIHAGGKYLRRFVDQHFDKEPMDKLKKCCSRSRPTTPGQNGSCSFGGRR